MSKIFSALKKAQGELASMATPVIELAEAGEDSRVSGSPEPYSSAPSATRLKTPGRKTPESRGEIRRAAMLTRRGSVVMPAPAGQRRVIEEYRMIRTKIVQ